MLSAQEDYDIEDGIIVLKSGSTMRGNVNFLKDKTIEIYLNNGYYFKTKDKYVKGIWNYRSQDYYLKNGFSFKNKGFYNALIVSGFWNNKGFINSFNFSRHYFFDKEFSIGLGIGYDRYNFLDIFLEDFRDNAFMNVLPIYGELRAYPSNKIWSPYYSMKFGYGLLIGEYKSIGIHNFGDFHIPEKGGYMIKPSIGLRYATRDWISIIFETSYVFQNTIINTISPSNISTSENEVLKRLSLGIGFIF